jgi:hypothetical protein
MDYSTWDWLGDLFIKPSWNEYYRNEEVSVHGRRVAGGFQRATSFNVRSGAGKLVSTVSAAAESEEPRVGLVVIDSTLTGCEAAGVLLKQYGFLEPDWITVSVHSRLLVEGWDSMVSESQASGKPVELLYHSTDVLTDGGYKRLGSHLCVEPRWDDDDISYFSPSQNGAWSPTCITISDNHVGHVASAMLDRVKVDAICNALRKVVPGKIGDDGGRGWSFPERARIVEEVTGIASPFDPEPLESTIFAKTARWSSMLSVVADRNGCKLAESMEIAEAMRIGSEYCSAVGSIISVWVAMAGVYGPHALYYGLPEASSADDIIAYAREAMDAIGIDAVMEAVERGVPIEDIAPPQRRYWF